MGAARGASIERRAHHDDGHVRALVLDPQQDVSAIEARHVVVEKHHAEFAVTQLLERGRAVRGLVDVQLEAAGRQDLAHDAAHGVGTVSYTHLRAHETDSYLVCRLLLEKKKQKK